MSTGGRENETRDLQCDATHRARCMPHCWLNFPKILATNVTYFYRSTLTLAPATAHPSAQTRHTSLSILRQLSWKGNSFLSSKSCIKKSTMYFTESLNLEYQPHNNSKNVCKEKNNIESFKHEHKLMFSHQFESDKRILLLLSMRWKLNGFDSCGRRWRFDHNGREHTCWNISVRRSQQS